MDEKLTPIQILDAALEGVPSEKTMRKSVVVDVLLDVRNVSNDPAVVAAIDEVFPQLPPTLVYTAEASATFTRLRSLCAMSPQPVPVTA